jgi:hypothetical protein
MPISSGRFLLFSLIVALLASLLFLPGLPGDFLFDDIPNIVNNEVIHLTQLNSDALSRVVSTPQISGYMRVLPTLSFALDFWRAGGADPTTFKITNIVLHALTAFALAWFFRSLLLVADIPSKRAQWLSLALALAWAAHPLQVSSVLYVVQRIQTMGTLFLVLALLAYLKARQAQIEGRSSRTGWLLIALLWVAAMGCKEDSILLPAFTLALELTVLRFAAASARLTDNLQRGYLFAALAGATAYLFVVIPHYWQWEAYPGRDFSPPERLLTQARVLCMYLWQIVWPLPKHMPFYYDWLQPSRGLLHPWTTLPAIAALLALLGVAWRLRTRWPLFALGVFLFFSAHFIASNVIGLELVFEHRNHFALIGAVLAAGSLLAYASQRLRMRPEAQAAVCTILLVLLGGATLLRAHSWNSRLSLARTSTELAPHSARAWVGLCSTYFKMGEISRSNPYLDKAIEACSTGAIKAPYALNSPALLIVLKTLRGDVAPQDWDRFQQRLETVHMSFDNRRAPQILSHHMLKGVKLDKQRLLKALDTLVQRAPLKPTEIVAVGYFIMNDLGETEMAIPYFVRGLKAAPAKDSFAFASQLGAEIRAKGRPDLAEAIEQLGLERGYEAAKSR